MRIAGARRAAAAAALAAAALLAGGCGAGGDGAGGGADGGPEALTLPRTTVPPSLTQPPSTTPAPPGGTTPAPGAGPGYRPPPLRVAFGRGPTIGALVRQRHAESSYGGLPRGFVPGGIPIGSRAGICIVPPLTDAVRAQLAAAARRQTPSGQVLTLHSDAILLADCGPSGRWALVTWTQVDRGDVTDWIDELRDDGRGRWTGTPPRAYPGCRMPLAAAAVWQVDVRRCGAGARRPPSTRRPRAAPPPAAPPPAAPRVPRRPRPQSRRVEPAPLDSVTI